NSGRTSTGMVRSCVKPNTISNAATVATTTRSFRLDPMIQRIMTVLRSFDDALRSRLQDLVDALDVYRLFATGMRSAGGVPPYTFLLIMYARFSRSSAFALASA